jgi:hypothetical protein
VIAGASVAIERVIEAFWTVMSRWKSSWWPLSVVADEVAKIVDGTESAVGDTFDKALTSLTQAKAMGRITAETLAAAERDLPRRKSEYAGRMAQLKRLAPDNQRVQLIASSSLQAVADIEKRYLAFAPALRRDLGIANQAITGLADFTASFKDNPGKRIWSIVLGAFLGLIAAGVLTLDVFEATNPLNAPSPQAVTIGWFTLTNGLFAFVGVALTGLLIGLGSNPTHEVIAFLKEAKKDRQAANNPAPTTSEMQPSAGNPAAPFRALMRADLQQEASIDELTAQIVESSRLGEPAGAERQSDAAATETLLSALPLRPPSYLSLRRR